MIKCVVIRGAGDLATGVISSLSDAKIKCIALESRAPASIRRKVSLARAVYEKTSIVEGVKAVLVDNIFDAITLLQRGDDVPLLIDPSCDCLNRAEEADIKVAALVDAIIAKRNLGTNKKMAPITIALGPGFIASEKSDKGDVDAVIETMRGHNLGRIIKDGAAEMNTGVPGIIGGFGGERVIHAPCAGCIELVCDIGCIVQKDDTIAYIVHDGIKTPVKARISGVLRGIIQAGYNVHDGMKIADIDPRISEKQNCFTISDKSRAIGNSTLHALLMIARKKNIDLWNP